MLHYKAYAYLLRERRRCNLDRRTDSTKSHREDSFTNDLNSAFKKIRHGCAIEPSMD